MIKLGQINKAAEIATGGEVAYETPVVITDETLDGIAEWKPDSYLRYLQRLCDAMADQRYCSWEDGKVTLICSSVFLSVETTFAIEAFPKDGKLIVSSISELGSVPLPPHCVDMRKSLRRRPKNSTIIP